MRYMRYMQLHIYIEISYIELSYIELYMYIEFHISNFSE
jgi:hypothetical protein